MTEKTVLPHSVTMPRHLPEGSDFVMGPVAAATPPKPKDDSFMSLDDRREFFPPQSGRFSTASYKPMTDDVIPPSRPGEWGANGLSD